jgi:hypothetical protein
VAQRTSAHKSSTKRRTVAKSPARSSKSASRSSRGNKLRTATRKSARSCKSDGEKNSAGDREVTIDRRRAAATTEAAADAAGRALAPAPKLERRKKVNRRRQIDPTTCERDYTDDEVEFMNAIDDYKRKSGRMFPTCSEVLEVVRGLGYQKVAGKQTVDFLVSQPATPQMAAEPNWSLESATDMTL